MPSECESMKIKGETAVDKELVITDKNGNEWIWIEVPKEITEIS